jgi:hypothetical protein
MTDVHYGHGQQRFSDVECAVLAARYSADDSLTIRMLAAELHANGETVSTALKRGGVTRAVLDRHSHAARIAVEVARAGVSAERMCALFDAGMSMREIAEQVGYTPDGARRALLRHGRRRGHKQAGYTLAVRQSGPVCKCGVLLSQEPGDGEHCGYCVAEKREGIVPCCEYKEHEVILAGEVT